MSTNSIKPARFIQVPSKSQSSSNANAVEPLTPTASAITSNATILPSSRFVLPTPDENDPANHPDILAPWAKLRVIQKNEMNAIVCTRALLKGEKIAKFYGEVQTTPTMYTLQIDDDLHVTCGEGGPTFTNHSCDPNAFFSMENITQASPFPILTALRDIAEGEEITFHYCHNEWAMAVPFFCLCGSKSCMGKIEGFSKCSFEQKRLLSDNISPFLAKKWAALEGRTAQPVVLPASMFDMPQPNEADPLNLPELLAPWPLMRVITKNEMNAIVATRPIAKGEKIAKFYGEVQTTPTMYTLQVDDAIHVTCSEGGPTYTNHSCDPNSYFSMEETTQRSPFPFLTALRDIAEGEELTFHYCHNEWAMAVPFHCLCGSKSCMGQIQGFSALSEEQKRAVAPHVSPFILKKWQAMQAQPLKTTSQ